MTRRATGEGRFAPLARAALTAVAALVLTAVAAAAAPVVEPAPGPACVALEATALACGATTAESLLAGLSALTHLDLTSFASAASTSAAGLTAAIADVPLPAAGWLLIAGMGGLGLFGKRRRDALPGLRPGAELEPLASAHRGSASVERAEPAPARPFASARLARIAAALRGALLNAPAPTGFPPGAASPVRPNGGAGSLWAAVAERGPPMRSNDDRGDIHTPRVKDCSHTLRTRLQGWVSLLAARLVRLDDMLAHGIGVSPVPAPVCVRANGKNGWNPHVACSSQMWIGSAKSASLEPLGVIPSH